MSSRRYALPAIIVIAIAGVMLWPQIRHKEALYVSCTSNLKQQGTALELYCSDWDRRYPSVAWQTSIDKYLKNPDMYTCEAVRLKGGKYGFAMDWHLLGVEDTALADPNRTVLLFETAALGKDVVSNLAGVCYDRHTNYQGRHMASFCYADGHVKSKFEVVKP